ncbi:MAG TPA: hypothetical protein VMM77_11215, partial [Gemmatimonadaceae bacterium]|nr:hypothetical protein [Gemmatimonadaceae bacterium]
MSAPARVELRLTTVAGLDDPEWAAAARSAAQRVVDALSLPVEPSVSLQPPAAPDSEGAPPYALGIGNRPARLGWGSPAGAAGIAAAELAPRLAYDLARNAELFVTDAVAEGVRARWRARAPEHAAVQLPDPDLARLLEGCVRAGRRVDHVLEADPGSDARDPLWWRLLEGALDTSPSLRLVVPARTAIWGPHGDAGDTLGDTLSDYVYEQTGVVLPPPDVRLDDDVEDAWIIEVCDLSMRIPAPVGTDAFVEQGIAVLQPWLHAFVTRETTLYRLNGAAEELPHLVQAVRARFGDAFITRSLRALVDEGVTVNDLRTILCGLVEIREPTSADEATCIVFHAPAGTPPPSLVLRDGLLDPEDAADCVRRWARRAVTQRRWNAGTLSIRLLTPNLESVFRTGTMLPGSADHYAFLELVRSANEP